MSGPEREPDVALGRDAIRAPRLAVWTRSDHTKWYTSFHPIDRRRELHHGTPIAQNFLGHRVPVAAKVHDDLIAPLLLFALALALEFRPMPRSLFARCRTLHGCMPL